MSSHQTRLSNPRNYALIALVVLLVLAGVAIDGPATLSTLKTAHSQQTTTKITPTSFPAPTDAMIPGWKKYTNNKDGYSIDAPSSWFAESFDYTNPNQIYNINFSFFPSAPNTSPSTPQTSFINIANPIAFTDYFKGSGVQAGGGLTALKTLISSKYDNELWNVTHSSSFTKISGHPALITDFFFFQAEDGIRALYVTGVQTCALPISSSAQSTAIIRAAMRRFRNRR